MDPITIAAISIIGFAILANLFTWIFNMVNTYQQTQAQKSIANSTKEGVEIQRSSAHSQGKIAENTSNLSSHLQNNQLSSERTPSNKKEQSQSNQR